jgi:hypothetical protein
MYDRLINDCPGFYDNISDGAAFTFYYLALRKDNNVEKNIGDRFAMLCSKEGNEKMAELGALIFTRISEKVVEKTAELEFAD